VTVAPRGALALLRLPRARETVVRSTDFNAAMQAIETADAGNAKQTQTPAFPAVILAGPDGSSWRLTVDAAGALHTTAVPR